MMKGFLVLLCLAYASAMPPQYGQAPAESSYAMPAPAYAGSYEQPRPYRVPNVGPPAAEPVPLPLPFGPQHIDGPNALPIPFLRPTLPLLPFYPVNPLPTPLPPLYPHTSDALLLFDSGYARAQMPLMPNRNVFLTPSFNVPPFHNPFVNPLISGAPASFF